MASEDYYDLVQTIYIAYYGRPADIVGRDYWAGELVTAAGELSTIINAFGTSDEAVSLYGAVSSESKINAIYLALFGRSADVGGLVYYTTLLNAGTLSQASIALDILNGATTGTDAVLVAKKLAVAKEFTAAMQTNTAGIVAYSGSDSATTAREMLSGVTESSTTVDVDAVLAEIIAASSAPVVVQGQTYTLTTSADTLDPLNAVSTLKTTTGNDTFRSPTDGLLSSEDYIDGGDGTDTLSAAIAAADSTLVPVIKNIESITLTVSAVDGKTFAFDALDVVGVSTLSIKNAGAVSMSASDEKITVSNLLTTATIGIVGGTAYTGTTASEIAVTFTDALAADTQKISISAKGQVGVLTLSTAETVEITATGSGVSGSNTIGSLVATAVKTLNIKGTGDLSIVDSDLAAALTIDASTSTGAISLQGESTATSTTITCGTGAFSFTSSSAGSFSITTGAGADVIDVSGAANTAFINTAAGDDEVRIGAVANVTAADVISGGDGNDTITISDSVINAALKASLALAVTDFEILKTTAVSEVAINFTTLSSYDVVNVASASTPSSAGVAGSAGAAAISAAMESSSDKLIISAARTGQSGAVATAAADVQTSGAGGAGVLIISVADSDANTANLKFVGNADITGGIGGTSANATGAESDIGGAGGAGLNALTIETLNIDISGTNPTGESADNVTFSGGTGGAAGTIGTAGTVGSGVLINADATINITSSLTGDSATVHNNLNLGTVVGANVTISAASFEGNLTATAISGNITIKAGSGKDILTGGSGSDAIDGGAGSDALNGAAGADIYTGGAGRDSFAISNSGTTASSFDSIMDFSVISAALTSAQAATLSLGTGFGAAMYSSITLGGAETDVLVFAAASSLATEASGIDVATASANTAATITASISAKGVVTLAGADAGLVDTLVEWVGIASTMAGTNGNDAVFEFDGDTYVFQQTAAAKGADTMVQLVGVTGVTGLVLVGSSVAAAVGDIFVV